MVVLPSRAGGGHEVPVDGCAATPATTSRKVQAAAAEVFSTHGLDAPLEEVARRAGVSIGTVYNRFGCREALIDAVAPEIVGAKLQTLAAQVVLLPSPRQRLSAFVEGMIDLQIDDPALNDAVLRRFPAAVALLAVCEKPPSSASTSSRTPIGTDRSARTSPRRIFWLCCGWPVSPAGRPR